MKDLIYAGKEVEKLCREKFPDAKIEDTSDYIHEERFSINLPDKQKEDFYRFAIEEGFIEVSFCFQLALRSADSETAFFIKLINKIEAPPAGAKEER